MSENTVVTTGKNGPVVTGQERAHACDIPKVATAVTGQERAHACDSNDRARNLGARACTDVCATWCVLVGTALHVRVYWDG